MNNREFMMEFMGNLENLNVAETPIWKTMVAVKDALRKANPYMPEKLIAEIVGNMNISVDDNFIIDTELFDVCVTGIVSAISAIYMECEKENMLNAVVPMSKQFSITYTGE
jgi:hypothetical protein